MKTPSDFHLFNSNFGKKSSNSEVSKKLSFLLKAKIQINSEDDLE